MVKSFRISFIANVSFNGEAVVPVLRDGMKPNFRAPQMAPNTFFITGIFEPGRDIAYGETQHCKVSVIASESHAQLFEPGQFLELYGKSVKKLGVANVLAVTEVLELDD